jgi:hypothetical protein
MNLIHNIKILMQKFYLFTKPEERSPSGLPGRGCLPLHMPKLRFGLVLFILFSERIAFGNG